MFQGGNKKLRDFFAQYNIPKEAPADFKYKTKAGIYYREMVRKNSIAHWPPPTPLEFVSTPH